MFSNAIILPFELRHFVAMSDSVCALAGSPRTNIYVVDAPPLSIVQCISPSLSIVALILAILT